MDHDYIPVDVSSIPYSQPVILNDATYEFRFSYNETNDTYYVDIYDFDGNGIIYGEPLILNQPLWRSINNDGLPLDTIVPLDESGLESEITGDNLGVTVQLCIDNLGAENAEGDANDASGGDDNAS